MTLVVFHGNLEHSCLWNKKCENHNNRQLRLKLLEVLRSQLSDHSVSFSGKSHGHDIVVHFLLRFNT